MDMKIRARESKAIQNLLKSLKRRMAREHNIKNYLASIERFCKFTKKTPDQLINEAEKIDVSETLQNFVDDLIAQDLAPKTVRANYYNVQKFFTSNKIKIEPKSVELPIARTVHEDRAITKEEIKLLLKTGDFRQRVLVLLPSSSGVRLGSIPYLKLEHLEKWEEPSVTNPVALNIPSEAAKGHRTYRTFISPECYEAIQDYLSYRRKFGENINSETPIIRDTFEAKSNGASHPEPLTYNGLKTLFHRIVNRYLRTEKKRRHEFKTTHGFRKFFRTCLDNAGVPAGAAAALMGHSAGLVSIYTRQTLEQLRGHYSKALTHLTIEKSSEPQIAEAYARLETALTGIPRERRKRFLTTYIQNLPAMVREEVKKRVKLENILVMEASEENCQNGNCQAIIEESELEDYLRKGYRFVSVLPSGKVVVES
jgi:integrase